MNQDFLRLVPDRYGRTSLSHFLHVSSMKQSLERDRLNNYEVEEAGGWKF